MREKLNIHWPKAITLLFFSFFFIWWVYINAFGIKSDDIINQLWGTLYGLSALYGAIWGIYISIKWGGFRSILGKSILLFSLGLLAQEVGQLSYSYYVYVLHIELPYPSIGDLFFYGTIPIYCLAVFYLAKASGVQFSLGSFKSKIQAILIPAVLLLFSYYFFLVGYEFDRSYPLRTFLDFTVPLGQAFYISLAILTYTLTRGMLGGIMKSKVLFILFALLAQYLADWTFLFQASKDMYYPSGTSDLLFLCAYIVMTFSLLEIKTAHDKLLNS